MNEQQLWLLRRIAERGLQSDMDVGIGANMLTALLDYVDELRASPAQLEEGHTNAVSFPNDIATLARAYLDVATFPSWNAGDCRFCGLFGLCLFHRSKAQAGLFWKKHAQTKPMT
jgi:hypothetical protein